MERLKENDAPVEAQLHALNTPVPACHLGLRNLNASSAIELTEKAPTDSDILEESSLDAGDASILAVDENHSLHSLQNL